MSPQLSSQHIKSICFPNKHLTKHFCPSLILVAYVQEVEVSARQYPRQPAISSHIYSMHSSFSVLCSSLSSSQDVCICVCIFEWELYCCHMSAIHVFLYLKVFFMGFCSVVVTVRSLNHTLDTQSIECACVYVCGCVSLCLCVWIRLHVCISVLFLRRYVGVFEAHGSSCCVPSYFPASVSTWPRAGFPPETPPQPESQPGCPAPSGRSSGCS